MDTARDPGGLRLRRSVAKLVLDEISQWPAPVVALVASNLEFWIATNAITRRELPHALVVAPDNGAVWWTRDQRDAARHHVRLTAECREHYVVHVAFIVKSELLKDAEPYASGDRYQHRIDRLFPAHREPSAYERVMRWAR